MKKSLLVIIFLLGFLNSFSQTLIRRDDMETPFTWRGSSTTGTNSFFAGGLSPLVDNPSNYPMYSSNDTCYRIVGNGLGGSTVERDTFIYPNVIVPTGRPYQMRFKLASFGISPATQTAAGVDQTDWIELQYTVNNGLSWWRDAQIQGISNSMWSFDGAIGTGAKLIVTRTGSVSTTTPTIYVSNAGNPVTDVFVNIPFTNITQIRIRFVTNINASGETFMLDDVEIWDMTVPLPIELIYFNGTNSDDGNKLFWATASETNNNYFTLFSSYDGWDYEQVAVIDGSGNSNYMNLYSYMDGRKLYGVVYYKLCQTDFDGNYECFDPIAINSGKGETKRIIRTVNILGQDVDENFHGYKLIMYEDGSVQRSN